MCTLACTIGTEASADLARLVGLRFDVLVIRLSLTYFTLRRHHLPSAPIERFLGSAEMRLRLVPAAGVDCESVGESIGT